MKTVAPPAQLLRSDLKPAKQANHAATAHLHMSLYLRTMAMIEKKRVAMHVLIGQHIAAQYGSFPKKVAYAMIIPETLRELQRTHAALVHTYRLKHHA